MKLLSRNSLFYNILIIVFTLWALQTLTCPKSITNLWCSTALWFSAIWTLLLPSWTAVMPNSSETSFRFLRISSLWFSPDKIIKVNSLTKMWRCYKLLQLFKIYQTTDVVLYRFTVIVKSIYISKLIIPVWIPRQLATATRKLTEIQTD